MIPNYEGRAMAFVIVVLKVLLGMDGITEYELSRIAEKVNRWAMEIASVNFYLNIRNQNYVKKSNWC